jgi:transposase
MSLDAREETAAIRTHFGAIFVSLELSRSHWLITSLSPGGREKMSRHSVPAGDVAGLLARFAELRGKAVARTGTSYPIIVIQEAGLDGFWIARVLRREGIESHVVDAASIAVSRRRRRAKTDKIDGEALVRALLAFKRGEPRVCSMVRAPTPEEEDRRRICRERQALTAERVRHVNPRRMRSIRPVIKGLLFSQGIGDYEPLRRDRRRKLASLRAGDGRALGPNLKAQIGREFDRLELLLEQIAAVEAARDGLLAPAVEAEAASAPTPSPARRSTPCSPKNSPCARTAASKWRSKWRSCLRSRRSPASTSPSNPRSTRTASWRSPDCSSSIAPRPST